MLLSEPIKDAARKLGFDLVGICQVQSPPHYDAYEKWVHAGFHGEMEYMRRHLGLKDNPKKLLEGAQSVIAVGLNYNQVNPVVPGLPRIAKYALGRDYHKVLRGKLRKLQEEISRENPDATFRACVDSAPIMERDFAQLAGLGWFGKNTMIINSHRGSWFFIGLLLTSLNFEADVPAMGGCGTCRACIDACPTGAIIEKDGRWQVDARSCISYLTIEHRGAIDQDTAGWTFGCDLCQEVCPFNQPRESQPLRARETTEPGFLQKRTWPSLKQLAVIQDSDWDQLTQGSAIRRTGLAGIRRNAAKNLE